MAWSIFLLVVAIAFASAVFSMSWMFPQRSQGLIERSYVSLIAVIMQWTFAQLIGMLMMPWVSLRHFQGQLHTCVVMRGRTCNTLCMLRSRLVCDAFSTRSSKCCRHDSMVCLRIFATSDPDEQHDLPRQTESRACCIALCFSRTPALHNDHSSQVSWKHCVFVFPIFQCRF